MTASPDDTRAFTLIELVIVLAVIAIVGAIILPNFLNTTVRARLKSDIQSARVLQNAANLHDTEQSASLARTSVTEDIDRLIAAGYLSKGAGAMQTEGAVWRYDSDKSIRVDITGCDSEVKALVSGLDQLERTMLIGAE